MPQSDNPWLKKIDGYRSAFNGWMTECDRYVDRYTLSNTRKRGFNILWSNVQTMRPAIFSRNPRVSVRRRFGDKDPIGRVASECLKRACDYQVEMSGFLNAMMAVVLDVLLCGRGVAWIRMESDTQEEIGPDGMPALAVTNERLYLDYIHYRDFAHAPLRTWQEVEERGWVARCAKMTMEEGLRRFGEAFSDASPEDETDNYVRDRG